MDEKFTITITRQREGLAMTTTKRYGEVCTVKAAASTEVVDIFVEYIWNFDKFLKRRLKKDTE